MRRVPEIQKSTYFEVEKRLQENLSERVKAAITSGKLTI
jgi:hypothetical protein